MTQHLIQLEATLQTGIIQPPFSDEIKTKFLEKMLIQQCLLQCFKKLIN